MKIKILFLALTVLFLSGCAKKVTEYYPDGKVKSEGYMKDGKMTGEWAYYYIDGKLKGKGEFVNGDGSDSGATGIPRNGRDGKWFLYDIDSTYYEQFYENRKIKHHRYFNNNKLIGEAYFDTTSSAAPIISKSYYPNGNIESESYIDKSINDSVYFLQKTYYENGKLQYHQYYKENSFIAISYFENEYIESVEKLDKGGEFISQKRYRKDGTEIGNLLISNPLKNNYLIFYTDKTDSIIAYNIAKEHYDISIKKIINENPDALYSVFVDKRDYYRLGIIIKEGLHTDNNALISMKYLARKISTKIFGKPDKVELALCDDDFNILRIVLP